MAVALLYWDMSSHTGGDFKVECTHRSGNQFWITNSGHRESEYQPEVVYTTQRIYENARAGDDMHVGKCFVTLHRGGKLATSDVSLNIRKEAPWILFMLFPLAAFVPEDRMPASKKTFLAIITIAEVIMLVLALGLISFIVWFGSSVRC